MVTTGSSGSREPHATRHNKRDVLKAVARLTPAYLLLGAWSLFTVFVIVWVIVSSLKTNRALFTDTWALPTDPQFQSYVKAWSTVKMGSYFLNSVFVVIPSVLVLLLVSAPAAYVLSRVKFRGSNLLTTGFAAGMGVPVPLLFVPLFVITTTLKVINTLPGLGLLYVSLSIPFTVYILTGFFGSLPVELEEAAVLDGCSDFQVFWRVMLPLAQPGMIAAAIFNFIGLWNEYQLAMVFVSEPHFRTLSLGLYSLQNAMQYTGDWVGLMAGVVIVMVPTIILYLFLSERMISGITMGAVKS